MEKEHRKREELAKLSEEERIKEKEKLDQMDKKHKVATHHATVQTSIDARRRFFLDNCANSGVLSEAVENMSINVKSVLRVVSVRQAIFKHREVAVLEYVDLQYDTLRGNHFWFNPQDHEKIHHPGSKDQLEEVWEETDHLDKDDFDPKTFFKMHDTNSDGYLGECDGGVRSTVVFLGKKSFIDILLTANACYLKFWEEKIKIYKYLFNGKCELSGFFIVCHVGGKNETQKLVRGEAEAYFVSSDSHSNTNMQIRKWIRTPTIWSLDLWSLLLLFADESDDQDDEHDDPHEHGEDDGVDGHLFGLSSSSRRQHQISLLGQCLGLAGRQHGHRAQAQKVAADARQPGQRQEVCARVAWGGIEEWEWEKN